ncbi:hypothetical protein DOY81_014422, partial [Sarcophaga bullata]
MPASVDIPSTPVGVRTRRWQVLRGPLRKDGVGLCVEVFDYLEHILQVQSQIFTAINNYRMSSMTPQGQCRLAPLITLIQDSNPLYDLCVRVMFHLHDGLPHDVLTGHRNRFNDIFNKLKAFYENVRPLQYFSDVIQLPHLPENAPNFYSEVDLGNYTAPVMVLPQEPEPEPTIESLVDLANAGDNNSQNSNENAIDERELIIRQLTDELTEKQMALEHYSNLAHQINNSTYQQSKMKILNGKAESRENLEKSQEDHKNLLILFENQKDKLLEENKMLINEKQDKEHLKQEIEGLKGRLEHQVSKTEEIDSSLKSKSQHYEDVIAEKVKNLEQLNSELVLHKQQMEKSQQEHSAVIKEFEEQIDTQIKQNQQLKKTAEEDSLAKQQQIEELLNIKTNNESALQNLNEKFNTLSNEKQSLAADLKLVQEQVESLKQSQTEAKLASDNVITSIIEAIKHSLKTDFTHKVFEGNLIVQNAKTNIDTVIEHMQKVQEQYKKHLENGAELTDDFVKSNVELIFNLRTLHENIALVEENTTDMEKAQISGSLANEMRESLIQFYGMLLERNNDTNKLESLTQQTIIGKLNELKKLLLMMSNTFTENLNVADMLQKELKDMDNMIEEAAQKMLEIQQNSKSKNEGIKLEVNDKILDSCTNLMQCIINLIKKSRDLQNEIVVNGKGTFSEKEFYKRNSQWTEGLISASKSVAKGANYL